MTEHWNAHLRFTNYRKDEEHAVTTVAPPKMGGAKLNIRYTVGDVPLAQGRNNSGSGVTGTGAAAAAAATAATTFGTMLAQQTLSAAITASTGSGGGTCSSTLSSATSSPVNEATTTTTTNKAKKKSPLAIEKTLETKKTSVSADIGPHVGGSSSQRESIVPEPIIEEDDRIESPSLCTEES